MLPHKFYLPAHPNLGSEEALKVLAGFNSPGHFLRLTRSGPLEPGEFKMEMDSSAPELIPCDEGMAVISTRSKVPITILTGFLGSGKTTLLQHILRSNHGLKIAVLMNEFAESNFRHHASVYNCFIGGEIERTITSQKAGKVADEWIEFDNGCLCCTVKDAAVIALEALLTKRTDIQHIVIETSGMANPGPIIQKLWVDLALDCKAELDGVVCLVDALHGFQRLSPESMSYSKEAATYQISVS